ncbi:MAG: DUF677 domain-containing protein [Candidatus Kaiserbacteria bacterium]|nr:DUF677 domain-containing protein [Candidatus Kaiserbacteria bacterium]
MSAPKGMEKAALAITRWIGSTQSILLHTAFFAIMIFLLLKRVFPFDTLILVFNTAVSLEAIYLALFIQMTVNSQAESIQEVGKDIDEIQEDIDEMQEDVEEIQEDVDELQEDVEDIGEDVEEMTEEDKAEEREDEEQRKTLTDIQTDLRKLMDDIEKLKSR